MTVLFQRALLKIKPKYVNTRTAVNLAYKIHGKQPSEAPAIVVIHGLLGSKRNWDSISKKLASSTNRSVVAVDVRNHGESPHDPGHSYPELASDVSLLIDTLSMKKTIVLGHSMGGRTGMVLALTEPSKVHNLIVVDISPVSTPGILNDFFPRVIDAMKSVDFKGQDSIGNARAHATKILMTFKLVDQPEHLRFILMHIGNRPGKGIGWMVNVDTLKEYFPIISTFPDEMKGKKYSGPTLFVGGDQSNYLPPSDIDGIRNYFPKAELAYVKNVGHNVHAEDPVTFFNIVNQFITKNG